MVSGAQPVRVHRVVGLYPRFLPPSQSIRFSAESLSPFSQQPEGSLLGPVEKACLREGAGRSALCRLRAHKLGALRAVRPHVLRVRSGRQSPCGLARGKARLGVHGLGG